MAIESDESGELAPDPAQPIDFDVHVPARLSYLSGNLALLSTRQYQAEFGIGLREWRIVSVLARYQPMTAIEVSRTLGTVRSSVSRGVQTLLSKGLIAQRDDPGDGRRLILNLTERGQTLHDAVVPMSRAREQLLLSALCGAERAQLRVILDKLEEQIDAMMLEGEGKPERLRT